MYIYIAVYNAQYMTYLLQYLYNTSNRRRFTQHNNILI
jgi:hypothetical protein